MSAQNDCTIYLYDIDGEGRCIMHFATLKGEVGSVSISPVVFPKGFFGMQQAMHQRMGHTLTLEIENERGAVWSVRIGRGDFMSLMGMIALVGDRMISDTQNGGTDVSQNLN